ncbi:hypothetical protein [Paenibacillus thermotolerans]|uniref:hypothetical protein n=1 Tax=Paenibacillus thermotolerans TaxID=3027807 RepID=UPI002367EC31|nr:MULTISPECIES: hypothetical protein [unclassified Paenibacillus]
MVNKMKWLAVLAVFTLAVAGCSGANGGGAESGADDGTEIQEPAGTGDDTVTPEEPADDSSDVQPGQEEPATDETPADGAGSSGSVGTAGNAEFVTAGEPKEIETSIEGMTEKVKVTPYAIKEFGISYDLRTDMGEPEVDADAQTVTYATQMGDEVARIVVRIMINTSVKDAVQAMKEQMEADGFTSGEGVKVITDSYSVPFNMANYQGDNVYAGFKVFGAGENALVVTHSYPFEAGDGMGAVLNEMLQSLKVSE